MTPAHHDDPGGEIARQDEMLELLFWFEGEGLGASATIAGMTRFLAQPEVVVRNTVENLMRRAYIVQPDKAGEYRLTPTGRVQAARRFADEFAELLSQGHGECSDPDCDCHDNPAGAAACHAERASGGHKH